MSKQNFDYMIDPPEWHDDGMCEYCGDIDCCDCAECDDPEDDYYDGPEVDYIYNPFG